MPKPVGATSAPMHATTSASPDCTARIARRIAITPEAPPNGRSIMKRVDSPKYSTIDAE